MPITVPVAPLTSEAFAPYGEVIEKPGNTRFLINNGKCMRHDALATTQVSGDSARVIISIFEAQPYAVPHTVDMVERHPLGTQAFFPLGTDPWLVIVCDDDHGTPAEPKCFLASPDQGVNLKMGLWHGVLTPLNRASDFLVVDRGGAGNNLEEHYFSEDRQVLVDPN